jgi:heme-degrading monooxygenase HmoA
MVIITTADRPDIFVVNVFRVLPENQQQLVDRILSAGDPADLPGLLSMNLLCSNDGTQVTNHMHWASMAAFKQATAGNSMIETTKEAIRGHIEGTGPLRQKVIKVWPKP